MKRICVLTALLVAAPSTPGAARDATSLSPATLMPRAGDHTLMWWAEGFPSHTTNAPWRRVIQTGRYAMALDTETMRIPHFGAVRSGLGCAAAARADNRAWQRLPPATLALGVTVNGKTYRCIAGGKWTRFSGPRLIESGRFLQRADVTDLVFAADDGAKLDVEARFETVAWPDRLALILAANLKDATLEISLATPRGTLRQRATGGEVALVFDPDGSHHAPRDGHRNQPHAEREDYNGVVQAAEIPSGTARPVGYDAARGWHRINLDGIEPIVPPGGPERSNDAIERVKLVLSNPGGRGQTARLLFEKTAGGIRQRIGAAITGVSAILRDSNGQPTGIPVQLSKNWHNRPEGGIYAGAWFHGVSQVRLPPRAKVELELTLAYGHWGGVAAASHAQLCLIGWGSNQLWDQSALGAWGESVCYEPDQAQAQCAVLDVRPVMVRSMADNRQWNWTHNVGGGDFFRLFDAAGNRVLPGRMRTAYERHGPCLTEVTYAGRLGDGIEHTATVSLARTDDIVRGIYRLRLDVNKATDFSRFVIFQIGADTYSYTGERKMALGNETGLLKEWPTQWGGGTYRTEPMLCAGRVPWMSLHEADEVFHSRSRQGSPLPGRNATNPEGAWANRGIVIRSWKARLGGKPAAPWAAERGVKARGMDTSTLDIVPPPGVARLNPGDLVEATFEHVIVPQFAADYYGPNEALRAALKAGENTWRMIHREAVGNDRRVTMKTGKLESLYPAVKVRVSNDIAEFTLTGGLGYVPVTFTGLTSSRGYALLLDGHPVNQSVHGNDFWQTDYDPLTRRWSRTYNLPVNDDKPHAIRFVRKP